MEDPIKLIEDLAEPGDQPGVTVFPVPTTTTKPATPKKPRREDLPALARSYAEKHGIDPDIFERQINRESRWNRFAKSPKGALGLAQFMPETGRRYGLTKPRDFFDPDRSLDASARHHSDLMKKYNGNQDLVLAAYNAGEGAVDDYLNGTNKTGKNPRRQKTGGVPPFKETRDYIQAIRGQRNGTAAKPDPLSVIQDLAEPDGDHLSRISDLFEPDDHTASAVPSNQRQALRRDAKGNPLTHDGYPAIKNADGTITTEESITVTDPRVNGGRPTNIPSVWQGKRHSQDESIALASQSGRQFPSFTSIDDAVTAAKARSAQKGIERDEPKTRERIVARLNHLNRIAKNVAPGGKLGGEAAATYYEKQLKPEYDRLTAQLKKMPAPKMDRERSGPSYRPLANDAYAEMGEFNDLKSQASTAIAQGDTERGNALLEQAKAKATEIGRRFGKQIEVGEGGGWPYVKERRAAPNFVRSQKQGKILVKYGEDENGRPIYREERHVAPEKVAQLQKQAAWLLPGENIKDEAQLDARLADLSELRARNVSAGAPLDVVDRQIRKLSQVKNDLSRLNSGGGVSAQLPSEGGRPADRAEDLPWYLKGYAADVASGFQSGVVGLGEMVRGVEKGLGVTPSEGFDPALEAGKEYAARTAERGGEGVTHEIARGIGDVAAKFPVYAATGPGGWALIGGSEAAGKPDAQVRDVVQSALMNFAVGRVLKAGSTLSLPKRVLLGGATGATASAIAGGSREQIIAQGILFGSLGVLGRGPRKGDALEDVAGNRYRVIEDSGGDVKLRVEGVVEAEPTVNEAGEAVFTHGEVRDASGKSLGRATFGRPIDEAGSESGPRTLGRADAEVKPIEEFEPNAPVERSLGRAKEGVTPIEDVQGRTGGPLLGKDEGAGQRTITMLDTSGRAVTRVVGEPTGSEAGAASEVFDAWRGREPGGNINYELLDDVARNIRKRGLSKEPIVEEGAGAEAQARSVKDRIQSVYQSVAERLGVKEPLPESAFDSAAAAVAGRQQEKASVKTRDSIPASEQTVSDIDIEAQRAATGRYSPDAQPTEAQKEAGNYQKAHVKVGGLDVAIENPQGTKRREEWPELQSHYGYIKRTTGGDDEQIDVFIKPDTDSDYSGPVFVVDQANKDGSFDEHKVMLGFDSEEAARAGYAENYTRGWKVGQIRQFDSVADFREWLKVADTTKPASEARELSAAQLSEAANSRIPEGMVAVGPSPQAAARGEDFIKTSKADRPTPAEDIANNLIKGGKFTPGMGIEQVKALAAEKVKGKVEAKAQVKQAAQEKIEQARAKQVGPGNYVEAKEFAGRRDEGTLIRKVSHADTPQSLKAEFGNDIHSADINLALMKLNETWIIRTPYDQIKVVTDISAKPDGVSPRLRAEIEESNERARRQGRDDLVIETQTKADKPVSAVRDINAAAARVDIRPERVTEFYKSFDRIRSAVASNEKTTLVSARRSLVSELHSGPLSRAFKALFREETGIKLRGTVKGIEAAVKIWIAGGALLAVSKGKLSKPEANLKNRPEVLATTVVAEKSATPKTAAEKTAEAIERRKVQKVEIKRKANEKIEAARVSLGRSPGGSGKAELPHALRDRLPTDPKALSDVSESATFREHGLGGFDVPSQGHVMGSVIAALHDPQIRDVVIQSVPVNVVDDLARVKLASQVSLHDESVLPDESSVDTKGAVSIRIDIATAIVRAIAGMATEGSSALPLGRVAQELNPTEKTGKVGKRHDASPLTESIMSGASGLEPDAPSIIPSISETPAEKRRRIADNLKREFARMKGQALEEPEPVGQRLPAELLKPAANEAATYNWRDGRNYLAINQAGSRALAKAYGKSVRGVAVTAGMAREIATKAKELAGKTKNAVERDNLIELARALNDAAGRSEEFAVVVNRGFVMRRTIRHELSHVARIALQRFYESAPSRAAVESLRNFDIAKQGLIKKGYGWLEGGDSRIVAHEAFAHIAGGQWEELGLSLREALEFGDQYMKLLGQVYKADALKRFDSLNGNLARIRDVIIRQGRAREARAAVARQGEGSRRSASEGRERGSVEAYAETEGRTGQEKGFADLTSQTETPEFKRWFGESKVVDEAGRPLVVYHGTKGEFEAFRNVGGKQFLGGLSADVEREGFFFSDNRGVAERYGKSGKVIESFVSIKKPLDLRNPGAAEYDALVKAGFDDANFVSTEQMWEAFDTPGLVKKLKRQGYDGAILNEDNDYSDDGEELTTTYVAFEPTQIKSTVGNRGTFDPNDANIFADLAPEDIPLPDAIKSGLAEIARTFLDEGRNDFDELIVEFEELLGDELFDEVAEFLPSIVAAEEAKLQEQNEKEARTDDTPAESNRRQKLYPPRAPGKQASEGSETKIVIPGTNREIPARYQVRELEDVHPSHNPQNFQPNPNYELVNDRRYDRERAYQQEIIANSVPGAFKPKRLINNSDTAEVGPPVIDSNGNVLGGNSRTMMLSRVYDAGNGAGYKSELLKQASLYGLDIKKIVTMKRPVLVREMTDETLAKQDAITELNVTGTRALTPEERSIAEANQMPDSAIDYIAGKIDAAGDDDTLAQVLDRSGVEIVNRLIGEGIFQPQERNALIKDAQLLPEAKARIQRLMMGRIFRDLDQLEMTPDSVKRNMERIIAPLLRVSSNPDWGIAEELRSAIDLVTEARTDGQSNLDEFARQPSMLRPRDYTPREIALGKALQLGIVKTAKAFRQYANEAQLAQTGGGLFGASTPDEAFSSAFAIMPKGVSDATSGRLNLEPGREGTPANGVRQAPVSARSEETDRGDAVGSREVPDARVRVKGDQGVSDGRAARRGEGSDQPVRRETAGDETGAAGSQQPRRSTDTGEQRIPSEHIPTSRVKEAATSIGSLEEKRAQQLKANSIKVIPGDLDNIRETLPFLKPAQQEDVHKAEQRFSKPDGYGMLFTNGTGTGKTYTGLGIVRRFASQGKTNIIIAVPNDNILSDWVESGKNLGLEIKPLENTQDNGKSGIVITTYANFGQNNTLAQRKWDLVIPDESHYLSSNAEGDVKTAGEALRAITLHPEGVYTRSRMLHPELHAAIDTARAAGEDKKPDRLYKQLREKEDAIRAEVEAAKPEERPRVVFLSATPFAYRENVKYAQGFLFDWNEGHTERGGYNAPDAREAFFIQHFGYRMRTGKLTKPDPAVRTDLMEQQFNSYLKKQGVLSGRSLDVEADYDRKFILVNDAIGNKIDEGMDFLWRAHDGKYEPLHRVMQANFRYHQRMYLLEALRARQVVPFIKKSLALNRKIVVFHDFNKGGGFHPFKFQRTGATITYSVKGNSVTRKVNDLINEFEAERPDLVNLDFSNLRSPVETMRAEFPNALFIHGGNEEVENVTKQERRRAKALFNGDDSGNDLIVVQSDAGKEGISLHDTTGKRPRVLFNLGMPVKPTAATQIEGRIYRTGQVSNAVLRYLTTGTSWERWTFAQKIAERAGTAENLALGEDARTLKQSFIDAFLDPLTNYEPSLDEGTGGKEQDRARVNAISDFERAKTYYFGQQKKTSRSKAQEGIDYFATPEPLGLKMVEWAGVKRGDKVLEPSAGHGAIARFFPEDSDRTVIEPSTELATKAALNSPGAQMVNDRFENHHVVNKYDAIVMNPPFGVGAKTAIEHLEKATTHLRDGGRVVALLPEGPAADKRLEKFLYGDNEKGIEGAKGIYKVADIKLPSVTFERAGTSVRAHVVVLEKQTSPLAAARIQEVHRDYSDATTINEFFDRIEHSSVPERVTPPDTGQGAPVGRESETEPATRGGSAEFSDFEAKEFNHTKSGNRIYVAKPTRKLPDFAGDLARAKSLKGRYSSFKGAGAIAGFHFDSAEARDEFLGVKDSPPDLSGGFADLEPPNKQTAQPIPFEGLAPKGHPEAGYITIHAPDLKPVKAAWDKFLNLSVRNLSHLKRVSPDAHTAALRAGGSRGQATVLLSLATSKINQALEGSGINWSDMRAALVESRLRGIRDRYQAFADDAYNSDDKQLAAALEKGLLDILKNIEGRAGLDDTLAQSAVAMLEAEDFDSLRMMLGETFEAAAERTGKSMEDDDFDRITNNAKFQPALALYKSLIEGPIAESHAVNEGVFSESLGPLDTYYPLVAVKEDGGILRKIFGGTKYPYRKPKNIANYFATGLAEHGYSSEMDEFSDRIRAAIRTNNKANLLSALDSQGLIRVLGRAEKAPDVITVNGETVPADVVETRADLMIVREGRSVRVPAARALIPMWLKSELKPLLDREKLEPGMGDSIINKIIEISLIGPLDLVFHSTNVLGSLVANTPFIGHSLAGKTVGNLPMTKWITAIVTTLRTDPTTEEGITDLIEMAKIGLVPPRTGTVATAWRKTGRAYARQTGAKKSFFSAPLLYGPKGLDVRARLVMYRIAKQINPNATPQQLFDFVTQLGVYNRELESKIERWAKASRLAPFATAGMTMMRNGLNAWVGPLGTQPIPVGGGGADSGGGGSFKGFAKRTGYRVAAQLSGGAAGLVLMWAIAYKKYRGKWPWEDEEGRLLQIPLNEADRNSKLGRMLYGDDPTKTAYVNFAFFSPLVSRGSRSLGLAGAFETRQLGGSGGQQFEYAQRDIMNSLMHPFTSGPLVRAPFVFLTGNEPSLTSLRDMTGRFSPQFFPATIKAAPGTPALKQRALEAVLNVNPFFQTGAGMVGIGREGEDKPGDDQKASRWVKMITDLVAPRLLGSSVDVLAKKQRLEKERKAAESTPPPAAKMPDDVRVELHKREIIPSKSPRKEGESDADYLKRSEAAGKEIAARIRALMTDASYKAMDATGKQEALKRIIKDSRHDLSTAPKGETDVEADMLQAKSVVEDSARARLTLMPEFQALNDEQKKKALEDLTTFFSRQFGVSKDVQKLPADARSQRAKRSLEILKRYSDSGVIDGQIRNILLKAKRAA